MRHSVRGPAGGGAGQQRVDRGELGRNGLRRPLRPLSAGGLPAGRVALGLRLGLDLRGRRFAQRRAPFVDELGGRLAGVELPQRAHSRLRPVDADEGRAVHGVGGEEAVGSGGQGLKGHGVDVFEARRGGPLDLGEIVAVQDDDGLGHAMVADDLGYEAGVVLADRFGGAVDDHDRSHAGAPARRVDDALVQAAQNELPGGTVTDDVRDEDEGLLGRTECDHGRSLAGCRKRKGSGPARCAPGRRGRRLWTGSAHSVRRPGRPVPAISTGRSSPIRSSDPPARRVGLAASGYAWTMASPTLASIRADVSSAAYGYLRRCSWMADLPGDAPLLEEFAAPALALMESGKRTRAALLAAAYLSAGAGDIAPAIHAGAAVELYQASALVHDDVIDHAQIRRGVPTGHVAFAQAHRKAGWLGDEADFGAAGAILLGDLLLSLSTEACVRACGLAPGGGRRALADFARMTGEVAFGQYLDVRAGRVPEQDDPVRAAMNVIVHKSARYSVVYPLTIGARLGGADAALVRLLAGIGRPLGIAYQLRDDDLGIFGDAEVTGKPLCGDVAEGKRTVLLALTGRCASPADADWLRSRLGGAVTEEDAERIRDIVASSGARSRHEALIAVHQDEARSAWERLAGSGRASSEGIDLLGQLLGELASRTN